MLDIILIILGVIFAVIALFILILIIKILYYIFSYTFLAIMKFIGWLIIFGITIAVFISLVF